MLSLLLLLGLSQICTADDNVVVFTVTSRSVTMRWAAYSGASYYKVSATPQNVPGSFPAFFLFNGDTVIGGLNTLFPNTAYTMRVDAMDDNLNVLSSIGTAEALTAPEIPDIELIYSKQSTSITVEFTEVNGALGYILRAMSDVGDFFEETQVHGSPGTVQGLLPFTNYTLSVMSVNLGGRSQPSYSVELSTVVVAPELETRSDTNSTITVTWDPVEHAVQYTLYIIREGSNTILKINTTGTEETFDQLEAGTWYSIQGTAWDEYGRLGDHNTTSQITRPRKPDPIDIVPAVGRSVGISVYWPLVYGADSYTATSSSGQNCSSEGDSYCIISPLDCGQNLSVVVISKNLAGPSVPSDEEDFATIPCPPEYVWVEEPTPGSCQVAWSEVPMADFYITFIKRDDGAEYPCNTTGRLCPFDCICGYTYLTTVFAYNPSGASPQGPIVNYTTVPCCPGNVSVELVSTETLEIIWLPVRGADLYETTAVQPNAVIHCNDTSPLCALSDLRCNTNYSVVVTPCSEQQGCNRTCLQQWHETAPCTPQILHINQTNDSIVRVYYTTPNAPGTSYTITAVGNTGTHVCDSESAFCELTLLSCGTVYKVVAVASNDVGRSLPSFSVPLETGPCCPAILDVVQVTPAMSNVTWSPGHGARSYVTALDSPRGHAKCHTMNTHCLMGCITCGTNYNVTMEAISGTGHISNCTYSGFSSSACCPTNVKLYRMSNDSMRVFWRSSGLPQTQNYMVDVYGADSNYTCTPAASRSYCDVQDVLCGDVYTVVVAPVNPDGSKVGFCPRRMYSVSCSGAGVGMVLYRGKR